MRWLILSAALSLVALWGLVPGIHIAQFHFYVIGKYGVNSPAAMQNRTIQPNSSHV